jgi:hypothetical protein
MLCPCCAGCSQHIIVARRRRAHSVSPSSTPGLTPRKPGVCSYFIALFMPVRLATTAPGVFEQSDGPWSDLLRRALNQAVDILSTNHNCTLQLKLRNKMFPGPCSQCVPIWMWNSYTCSLLTFQSNPVYRKHLGFMNSGDFWDVTPCASCKNRRFG